MPKVSEMWREFLLYREGQVRREHHLRDLRTLLGRGHDPRGDYRDLEADARRWIAEGKEEGAVDGSLALMPAIIPKHEHQCLNGHRMFFRTALFADAEKITIFGCDGEGCSQSVFLRMREFASDHGVDTTPRMGGIAHYLGKIPED